MKQQFTITLEGTDDVTPVVIRLRQLLKLAGRAYRLRCVEGKRNKDAQAHQPHAAPQLQPGFGQTPCTDNAKLMRAT